ncbi:MAG: hypothetical protein D3917_10760 [Candidatus Electrothrix sp. AX5]|nr:hypothetical protein [Candidatus Electrothrix sp. AX5]
MQMTAEVQNRIVSVALPLTDGNRQYFSGYILGDGVIITCLHGFTDPDVKYDPERKIIIRSQSFKEDISFKGDTVDSLEDTSGNKLILFSAKEYDVALMQCNTAKARFAGLLLREPDSKGVWDAGGYPRYNINQGTGYENFSGEFNPAVTTESFLKLKVINPELEDMASWQEVSGSPVFIAEKLAAIVIEYSTHCDPKNQQKQIRNGLKTVHLKRLHEADEEFRRILRELEDSCGKSAKILQEAEQLLENNEQFKKVLDNKAGARQIVRNLAEQDLPNFLQHLDKLEARREDKRTLALALLPWYFVNQSVVIDQSAKNAVDIDCIYDVAAECSMAALDCREAHLSACRPADKETDQDYKPFVTRGKFALTPECGIEKEPKKSLDALNRNILSGAALDQLIQKRFAEDEIFPELVAKKHLEQAKAQGNSFYLVVRLESTSFDKMETVDAFKAKYPDLIILNLAAGTENNKHLAEHEMPLRTQLPALIAERKHDE